VASGRNPAGSIAAENLAPEFLSVLTAGKTVLAIGPGLGQARRRSNSPQSFVGDKIPAVIDADRAEYSGGQAGAADQTGKRAHTGAHAHPGEMARLAGVTVAEVQADRLGVAHSFAQRTGVTLVLKGARTLIAHPDGRVAVNTSGNPGMAKAAARSADGIDCRPAGAVPGGGCAGGGSGGLFARAGADMTFGRK